MVIIVVIGIAALVAVAVVAASAGRNHPIDAIDPERPERWLVRHAPRWARGALRHADRRVIGGAATVVVFAVVFGAALVIGWIFDGIDEARGFARWDESAAEWGARNATDTSTTVLDAVTQLGGTPWLVVVMIVVGLLVWWRQRTWQALVFLLIVALGVTLLNNGLKLLVDRERPDIARLTGHSGASFPSGHSAAAAACWAAMALVVTRRSGRGARIAAAAVAAVTTIGVATSRVLLGVHWVSDVLAGVVVGWAWFLLVAVVFGGRLLRIGEPAERVAADRTGPTLAAVRDLSPHLEPEETSA